MSTQRPRSLPHRFLVAAVVAATATTVVAVAPAALAAPKPKTSSFSATISPTTATVGTATTFAITLTNATTSTNDLGSAQVVVPAGFGSVTPGTTTVPSGFVYATPPCSGDSPSGCGALGSRLVEISTPSSGGAAKIGPGKSITFYVTATPTAKGQSTWVTEAKNSASWSTGQLLTLNNGSPVVTVYGAAAQLAFGTAPPSTVVAGQTFSTTVRVLDADGDPVPSTASVTLSGTGLHGTTTVAAVNGTASFSGLSLTTAGSIPVTAASAGLASASASVTVTPGKPTAPLVVSGPIGSVGAGTTFTVGVTVNDAYGNTVDPQVAVALSVDGSPRGSKTTAGGSASFSVVAPTSPGSHSLTVSTSGTFAGSTFSLSDTSSFTVTAGAATHLTIDSVTDEAGVGELTKNGPFDVAVTARDAFENPASYTGGVTLATSGGTGSALGSLGGTKTANFSGGTTVTVAGAVYSGYGNSIILSASAPGLTQDTAFINVYAFITAKNATPGVSLTVDNTGCADATPSVPVCSTLILPKGANGRVTLGQQICNPFTPCLTSHDDQANLVEAIADLTGLYTRNSPASIEMRCDKTLCGGTGVSNFPMLFQVTGASTFSEAPACLTQGRIPAGTTFCQDLRANHRDNAGDLVAYIRFTEDLKNTLK